MAIRAPDGANKQSKQCQQCDQLKQFKQCKHFTSSLLRGATPISDGILFHLLCHPRFGLNYIFCVKPDVQITKDFNSHSDKYKLYSLTVVFSIAIIRAYLQLFLQGCSSKAILRGALPLDVLPLNCLNFSSARCRLT